MKETDLFEPVKRLFEEQGYTVYSEVDGPSGVCDVVAVHGAELVAVELKVTLGLDVMEQANSWRRYAQRVYCCIPKPKRPNHFARMLVKKLGMGLLEVDFPNLERDGWIERAAGVKLQPTVSIVIPAQWNRHLSPGLRNALREEQRNGPPGGTAGGGHVTDYKLTMAKVREYVQGRTRNGAWLSVADILEHCETHWATPKSGLPKALQDFESSWCESKKENGRLYFRYKAGTQQHTGGD